MKINKVTVIWCFVISQAIILLIIILKFKNLSFNEAKFTEEYLKWLGGGLIVIITYYIGFVKDFHIRKRRKAELIKLINQKIRNVDFKLINNILEKMNLDKSGNKYEYAKKYNTLIVNTNKLYKDIKEIVIYIEQFCSENDIQIPSIYYELTNFNQSIKNSLNSRNIQTIAIIIEEFLSKYSI